MHDVYLECWLNTRTSYNFSLLSHLYCIDCRYLHSWFSGALQCSKFDRCPIALNNLSIGEELFRLQGHQIEHDALKGNMFRWNFSNSSSLVRCREHSFGGHPINQLLLLRRTINNSNNHSFIRTVLTIKVLSICACKQAGGATLRLRCCRMNIHRCWFSHFACISNWYSQFFFLNESHSLSWIIYSLNFSTDEFENVDITFTNII